jgi:hypothetical protein
MQQVEIMQILRSELISLMGLELCGQRRAADFAVGDTADDGWRDVVRVVVEIPLFRPAVRVRRTGMKVDSMPPDSVSQLNGDLDIPIVGDDVPDTAQYGDRRGEVRPGNPKVKIPMHPRLPSDQGINAPTTIHPDVDVGRSQ